MIRQRQGRFHRSGPSPALPPSLPHTLPAVPPAAYLPRSPASAPHAHSAAPPLSSAPRSRAGRRLPALAVPAALLALHLALVLAAYNPAPNLGGDNATYLALARSLLERGDFVELWDPALRPQALYPPLFPAVLALGMMAGLRTYVTLKYVVAAFAGLGALASYLWMRRAGGRGAALVAGLWLALGAGVVDLGHWVLSDVPFWSLTALALWAWTRAADAMAFEPATSEPRSSTGSEAGGSRRSSHSARNADGIASTADADGDRPPAFALAWVAVAALGTLAAEMTRSAGLPLVVAAAVWLVVRRRWRALALYAAILGPVLLGWNLRGSGGGGGGAPGGGHPSFPWAVDPYRPELGNVNALGFLRRIWDNLAEYGGHHVPTLLLGRSDGHAAMAAGALVTALAFAGWIVRLRRRGGVAEAWLPLYLGLILTWPQNWSGERLILPALPVMLLCAAEAAGMLLAPVVRRIPARRRAASRTAALACALAGVALAAAPGAVREVRTGRACTAVYRAGERFPCVSPAWHDYFALADRARGRLPRGAAVISRKPTLWFMLSGYRSRVYPFSAVPDSFFRAARQAGAGYVVDDQIIDLSPLYLHPILRARPHAFCVLPGLALPNARLLRILPAREHPLPGDTVRGEEHIPPCAPG
ncbi:MAG: hypothetical protein JWM27_2452 [Gemmatimonadetes bacterium]|nr:hypothetical protein [Gemmatimonadota bacterium]